MTDRQLKISGVPVTVVSDEEAEKAEAVVCMRKVDARVVVPGSQDAQCSECGHTVVYAPSAPKTPPKRCFQCALERLQGGHA